MAVRHSRGRVVLTDFGLAKDIGVGVSDEASRLTRSGTTLGTPAYMSPELARGALAELTPASDVWALGCVLHELLAGRPAFHGDSPAAIIGHVLTGRPSALPRLPSSVRRLTAICLQRSAPARPATGAVLRAECERVLGGGRPRTRFRWPRRRGWWVGFAGGAAAVVAAVAVATSTSRRLPTPGTTRAEQLADRGWQMRQSDLPTAGRLLRDAVQAAPARHEWRVALGLLQWANRDDVESAVATWRGVPATAPHSTRARWLEGLAWMARSVTNGGRPDHERALAAWGLAAGGTEPEATWAQAGLLFLRQEVGAIDRIGEPGDWTASLLLAAAHTASGMPADIERAVAAYDRAVREGPPLAWVRSTRSALRLGGGDISGALADAEAALELHPGDSHALVNRANARLEAGDVAGATADYDAAIAGDPGDAVAHYSRGCLRDAAGDRAGALADYDAALRLDPGYEKAWFNRSNARQAIGDQAGAIRDLDALLRLAPRDAEALARRGRLRHETGDLAGARADFDAALTLAPDLVRAWRARAILREEQRDVSGALADLDALLAVAPADSDALYNRAVLRQQTGDLDGAITDYGAIVTNDPGYARAWFNRAVLRHQAADLDRALADYDAAIAADPGFVRALNNRGLARHARGDLTGAIADFDATLALDPDSVHALTNRGAAHIAQGAHALGAADLERALALAPPDWPSRPAVLRKLARARAGR